MTQTLTLSPERQLAYQRLEGQSPTVMFCGGFKSDMTGSKALALEAFCRQRGQAFVRFDYTGHGQSSGQFEDGCMADWLADALAIFDALTQGQVVLVGSSMGAWIALHVAIKRRKQVSGLLGIASAPDFTERLIWQALSAELRHELMHQGVIYLPSCYGQQPYAITKRLIEDGREHLLLDGLIAIDCAVRLIHGTADEDVPIEISQLLMERLESSDVQLTLVKDGNHRLSSPAQLAVMTEMLEGLMRPDKLMVDGNLTKKSTAKPC